MRRPKGRGYNHIPDIIKKAKVYMPIFTAGYTMKGKVKFFNEAKGFGFIIGEDGKQYFVHSTGLEAGVSIRENDTVTFEVTEGDKGPKAVKVTKA